MELKVREEFSVKTPYERAWEFFSKPDLMLGCIPGAKVKEIKEDGSFSAEVKVKLGAITLNFTGNMKYEELNKDQGKMVLTGEGKEKGGAGRAKARIESNLIREEDSVKVEVLATVDITGRILQYGRGMFEQVAKEYFAQFSECASKYLEQFQEEVTEKKIVDEVKPPQAKEVNMIVLIFKAFLSWIGSIFKRG